MKRRPAGGMRGECDGIMEVRPTTPGEEGRRHFVHGDGKTRLPVNSDALLKADFLPELSSAPRIRHPARGGREMQTAEDGEADSGEAGSDAAAPGGSPLCHLADIVRGLTELAQAAAELAKKPLEPLPPSQPGEAEG
ncbi:hypothetical protein [Shinella pollutisoli]|nr:hypothetical protein [Shinella pollutisoli]